MKKNKKHPNYNRKLKHVSRDRSIRVDPLGIPNVNFSVLDGFMDSEEDTARLSEFKKQRIERGFDDTECWNLYRTIAAFVLPRLKVFKEQNNGYPGNEEIPTFEKWNDALDKMIYAFDYIVHEELYDIEAERKFGVYWNDYFEEKVLTNGDVTISKDDGCYKENMVKYREHKKLERQKIQEGLELFGKHFQQLWW